MADIRILKEEVLSDKKYTLKQYDFERKNRKGEWTQQQKQVFDHGNAATVLLYNTEKNTVILTRQFRLASYVNGHPDGRLIETPAGLLEKGEAPEQTMLREIKEETGYDVPQVTKIFEAYSSAGVFTEIIHYFVAPYTSKQRVAKGGGLEEEGEELDVLELPFSEAWRMVESGEIRDAKTLLLLHYAKTKGLL